MDVIAKSPTVVQVTISPSYAHTCSSTDSCRLGVCASLAARSPITSEKVTPSACMTES
jgi:hypothetical protein